MRDVTVHVSVYELVSINTPRAGCDCQCNQDGTDDDFNQRTPCGVRLTGVTLNLPDSMEFQSNAPRAGCNYRDRNPCCRGKTFQSNAPRAGCNETKLFAVLNYIHFNLMHPVRGATRMQGLCMFDAYISI